MLRIMIANGPEGSSIAGLVLFCRRPAPGVGKQRIAADLGARATSALADKLLDAALEDAADWPGPVIVAPADPADADWAAMLLRRDCRVMPQPAGNLGERLNAVDRQVRETIAVTALIFIGSDSPALTAHEFAAARSALLDQDVVLLPADDGGVTLMGARVAWPSLAGLRWETEYLAADLERCCLNAGLTVHRLAEGYDIDRVSDLPRLMHDLAADRRPARARLHQWLKQRYD